MKKYTDKLIGSLTPLTTRLRKYRISAYLLLKDKTGDIRSSTTSSVELVPLVLRKPSVLWRWLFLSYRFYLILIVTFILMNTVVDAAIDKGLTTLYPPVKTKKLFGLMVEEKNDPRIAWQRKFIRGVLWTGGCGLSVYVLLLSLPGIVRKTTRKAGDDEAMADSIITEKPSESILLYNKALKLVVDQSQESILKSKIDSMDNALRSVNIEGTSSISPTGSASNAGGTMVLAKDDLPDDLKSEDIIGADGRYRIEKKIGQGAMGVVFLGKDQLLFRDVALKKLGACQSQNDHLVTRLQQEARALARLSHPNIVQIYDFIQEKGQYWIAMEYVEGRDLECLVDENGKYPVHEAVQICRQIAEAMGYAHNRGVVHRDFKPSNVLMTSEGDPKVMDFGLAKLTHSSVATMAGSLIGSPAFMSPEQAMGEEADKRSDIYSLGVTLYQLVIGDLPFTGDLKSVITQKISGQRPPLEALGERLPPDLVKVVGKMMANDPDERPATMDEVCLALKDIEPSDS